MESECPGKDKCCKQDAVYGVLCTLVTNHATRLGIWEIRSVFTAHRINSSYPRTLKDSILSHLPQICTSSPEPSSLCVLIQLQMSNPASSMASVSNSIPGVQTILRITLLCSSFSVGPPPSQFIKMLKSFLYKKGQEQNNTKPTPHLLLLITTAIIIMHPECLFLALLTH